MNNKKLLALYGLKWNPFLPDIPPEALWVPKEIDHFSYRVENLIMDGGFAMVCAEPGMGKSKTLQILTRKLASITDVVVGVMQFWGTYVKICVSFQGDFCYGGRYFNVA